MLACCIILNREYASMGWVSTTERSLPRSQLVRLTHALVVFAIASTTGLGKAWWLTTCMKYRPGFRVAHCPPTCTRNHWRKSGRYFGACQDFSYGGLTHHDERNSKLQIFSRGTNKLSFAGRNFGDLAYN